MDGRSVRSRLTACGSGDRRRPPAGTGAAAVFGPCFAALDTRTTVDRDVLGVAAGLAYGAVLSLVGSRIVFRYLLDSDLAEDERLVFHVGHAIYGLTLGTWVASWGEFGEVYDWRQ